MADTQTEQIEEVSGLDPALENAADSRGLLARLKVFGFIGLIVLLECSAAYFYMPSAGKTAAIAAATSAVDEELEDVVEPEQVVTDQVEIDLGKFSIMAFQPNTNTTLVIDFHLFGSVKRKDRSEFETLFKDNEKRFRDEVLITIRSADLTELTDPGLGLIKRKFLAKTNKLLGKPLLQAVIFSDFSFIEQ